MSSLLGLLLALIAVGDAFVEFDKSSLYDEKDFEGHDMVYVPNYCSLGCHIYASIPTASEAVAKNIFIQADGKEINLFDANANAPDGKKTPFAVQVANFQVNFANKNAGLISAPIAVWILRADAPLFGEVEVYDGASTSRLTTPTKGIMTILGVELYRLEVMSSGIAPAVISFNAISAGFDALDSPDKCTRIIKEEFPEDYQDLHYAAVRSPLLTLALSVPDTTTVQVSTDTYEPDQIGLGMFGRAFNMFVASPGYIGCSVKPGNDRTKTFRSSLYEAETKSNLISTDPISFVISADLNTDNDHAVNIVDDNFLPIKWYGTSDDLTMNLKAKDLTITWTRNDADLDQYFLIRIEPDKTPIITTTVPEPEKTTTAEPEPEPVKTTTEVPEPEPVKTTTQEPEPEPVKTTTSEPEPVPVRTTTLEPEPEPIKTTTQEADPVPVKTTTLEQEPEPIKTTTAEPVPEVKTTTSEPEPDPVKTTTVAPEDPDPIKTTTPKSEPEEPVETTTGEPEPVKSTSPLSTTRRTMPTTEFHPKSTVTKSTVPTVSPTTVKPTTSGAGYGSLFATIVLAASLIL